MTFVTSIILKFIVGDRNIAKYLAYVLKVEDMDAYTANYNVMTSSHMDPGARAIHYVELLTAGCR